MQTTGCRLPGQRPVGDVIVGMRCAPYAWIGRLGRAQEFVGADRQRFGEAGEMVESESTLTGFEPAERGHVDARAAGDVLQSQAALEAQITQTSANTQVDVVFGGLVCLNGKLHWQI